MFLCASVFIFCVVALSSVSSAFSDKTLLCSSDYTDIWYSYEGPVYYLSVTVYPCYLVKSWYTLNYTIVPMFTVARAGYHAHVYFKNQLWFEYVQPDVPCEDAKICYIIKGETLQESCPLLLGNSFFYSEGEYHIYVNVNIVDDVNRSLTLRVNITLEVKRTFRKHAIFEELGRQAESCD